MTFDEIESLAKGLFSRTRPVEEWPYIDDVERNYWRTRAMNENQLTREEALARIAVIDAEFEKATGWGSWMVMCANEREDLATRFGLPHKNQARCGGRRTD